MSQRATTYERNAYFESLKSAINLIINSERCTLFDCQELIDLNKVIRLPPSLLLIVSRLVLRRGPWFRSSSFLNYDFPIPASEVIELLINDESNIIEILNNDSPFHAVWDGASCCLTMEQIILLSKRMGYKPHSNRKHDFLSEFEDFMKKQKTLSGKPLTSVFPKVLTAFLKSVDDGNASHIIRLNPSVCLLLRRSIRLAQITCSTSSFREHGSGLEPPVYNAPLLVTFNKIRFPSYVVENKFTLFKTMRRFRQWESSLEFKICVEKMVEMKKSDWNSVNNFLINSVGWCSLFDPFKLCNLKSSTHKIKSLWIPFQSLIKSITSSDSIDIVNIISVYGRANYNYSDKNGFDEDISLDEFILFACLIALTCLISYFLEVINSSTEFNHECDPTLKYDAGSNLSHICCMGAEIFAKSHHMYSYELANLIYEILLLLPFLESRRGLWYRRISINFDHIKERHKAANSLYRGLIDKQVQIHYKVEFIHRLAKVVNKNKKALQNMESCKINRKSRASIMTNDESQTNNNGDSSSSVQSNLLHSLIDSFYTSNDASVTGICMIAAAAFIVKLIDMMKIQAINNNPIHHKNTIDHIHSFKWSCNFCTFLNNSLDSIINICQICGNESNAVTSRSDHNIIIIIDEDEDNIVQTTVETPKKMDIITVDLLDYNDDPESVDKTEDKDFANNLKQMSHQSIEWILKNYDSLVYETILQEVNSRFSQFSSVIEQTQHKIYNEYNPQSLILNDLISSPKSFSLIGRRFGESSRRGKSRFCGRVLIHPVQILNLTLRFSSLGALDELLTVEEYVLHKFFLCDLSQEEENEDSENLSKLKSVIDCGGWQGWHCEGSIFRTLYGIFFWDILFMPQENSFLCPYQDCALDLTHSSFYRKREEAIARRLHDIRNFTMKDIYETIESCYRLRYNQSCRMISWKHKLAVVQLCALCLGANALSSIFTAFGINYRLFSSGAPDLFLIRIRSNDAINNCCRDWVDLDKILGLNWREGFGSISDKFDDDNDLIMPTKRSATLMEDENVELSNNSLETENSISLTSASTTIFDCVDQSLNVEFASNGTVSSYAFDVMCIEVKGPTDHLSEKQSLWLHVLSSVISAYVCNIKEK
eukprot:gene8466-11448_t